MAIQTKQNFKLTELSNGVKVLSEQISHIESFSLGFWFNVGTRDEIKKLNGICHFIEHMLFKGSHKRSARKISDMIESYGGYLNAFTSKENTCYYGRGLSQHVDRTFDVLADMVQYPIFRAGDIKKESGVIIDELHDIEDNPEELIFDKFEEIIFQGNSLAMPIIGNETSITSFDHATLHAFHKQHYNLNNMLISATGNLQHEELVALAEKHIQIKTRERKRKRPFVEGGKPRRITMERDISQVHCIIGRKSYGYKDQERLKLSLLSAILGEGSSSRLFQAVREKQGITYQINTFVNSYYDASAFGVYFSTNEQQVGKAITIIEKELKKIRTEAVPARELKRVKEYMKGSIILGMENTSNRMIRMASNMIYHNRFIPVDEVIAKIDAITSEEILELARQTLDESQLTQLVMFAKRDGAGKE